MFRAFRIGKRNRAAASLIAGLAVLAAILVGGAAGASAQSGWDKVVAEAKKEGKVVVYNGTNFKIVRKLGDLFQKQYGIAVEVLDGRATEIRERIRTEQAAGRFIGDVSYTGRTTAAMQTAEGHSRSVRRSAAGQDHRGAVRGQRHLPAVERRQLRAPHQHQPRQGRHQELAGAGGPEMGRQDPERRSARAGRRPGLVRGHLPHASAATSTTRSPPTSR